jgi:N-acetylglucosaminyl-diphospho-decaprenol L-rhamnosyltransferase
MSEPAVAIAVVSWNTRDLLAGCLESLAPEHEAGRARVWVVDNASSDGSAELVRERFAWANLIASPDNLGFGAAVNYVAERTDAKWLAPANADVRVERGALERLIATGRADPGAGAVAPRLLLPDGSTQHSAYAFPTVPFTLLHALGALRSGGRLARRWPVPGAWDPDRPSDVPWAVGAFLIVRRSAWDEVGGFDPGQWMYAEDLDLGWRLHEAGWRTRYEPEAVVHHDESAAVGKAWGGGRYERWHRSTYAWMLRRRGALRTRLVALANVAGYGARAALLAPGAALRLGRAKQRRRDAVNAVRAHRIGLRPRSELDTYR